jgi:hypothetical protein
MRKKTKQTKAKQTERDSATVPAVLEGERLTTEERKKLFARNLDRLISIVGMSRKEVADEIGVQHKLVLRLVSDGVSRLEERNVNHLKMIGDYFELPSTESLWSLDILSMVLVSGSNFVKKFQTRLQKEREKRLANEPAHGLDEMTLLDRALGFESAAPLLSGPWADKIRTILASPKAEQFKRLINDYHELAIATGSAE